VAKSFIGRALFHTPGGEMNFASTGSDNNIRLTIMVYFFGMSSRLRQVLESPLESKSLENDKLRHPLSMSLHLLEWKW